MRKAEKRWNLLDWCLLAAALAVLVGGAWLMRAKPWKQARREVLICILRTSPFDGATKEAGVLPREGDAVLTAAGGERIGRVLATETLPQTVLAADGDAPELVPCPDRYVAVVRVRLVLSERSVGAKRVAAGGRADLILGGYFASECEILSVEVTGDAE